MDGKGLGDESGIEIHDVKLQRINRKLNLKKKRIRDHELEREQGPYIWEGGKGKGK